MRNVNGARVAIFQGDPVNAARMIVEASHALDKVEADITKADKMGAMASTDEAKTAETDTADSSDKIKTATADATAPTDEDGAEVSAHYVVFDARMMIVDDFVVTPEKETLIGEPMSISRRASMRKGRKN